MLDSTVHPGLRRALLPLLVSLFVVIAPPPLFAQDFVRGDVNGNTSVNLADLLALLNFLYNGVTPAGVPGAADANDNGVVEITDAVYLCRRFNEGGPPPPAPYPTAGPDPTPPNFPTGPDGSLTFRIGTVSGCPGDTEAVPISVDNDSILEAFSFRILFDPTLLLFGSVDNSPISNLIASCSGGPPPQPPCPPDFFSAVEVAPGELVIGSQFRFTQPTARGLPPGTDQLVLVLEFLVLPGAPGGTTIPIALVDDAAADPTELNVGSVLGQSVLPVLEDGGIFLDCSIDEFLRGDANSSGAAGVTDALYLLEYLFLGGPPSACARAADASGDDVVGIGDVVYLLQALFAGGPAIPQPYPSCGPGPATPLSCFSYPPGCP